jgi:EpsD family peptidyl-prolyl cis-trans isomerase
MKKMVWFAFLLAALSACSKNTVEQKGPFLAKVGTSQITQADFNREFQSLPDYARQMFQGAAGKEKFLDEIVKKEVLYQEAIKKGMDKNPDFIRKVEDFKKLTLISELLEKEIMSKAKMTDQEIREYYDKHKQDFATTNQIRVSHILVKTEEEANKVLERLKKGEKFEAVAKKESVDRESGQKGGDLGYFSRGQQVPDFVRAAAALKVGEIGKPVKSEDGYHIVVMTDKKMGPVIEFERVKDMISQKLSGEKQKEAFDKYLAELKKNYPVEINKDALQNLPLNQEKPEKTQSAEQPSESKEGPKKK